MEWAPDLQYLLEKSIRRGVVSYSEVREAGKPYDVHLTDMLVQELCTAGVRLVDEKGMLISSQTNVLMNSLRFTELVSLALQLPAVPKVQRRLYEGLVQRTAQEIDLRRLDYLDSDGEWYYLAPPFNRLQRALRGLFQSGRIPFAKEWRSRRDDQAFLEGVIAHPEFITSIVPQIREHYLCLPEVGLLVHWITATNKAAPSMIDIVHTALRKKATSLKAVLFSEQASTADSALTNRRDVCFSCPPEIRCHPLQNESDPYNVLSEYRYSNLDKLLVKRYPGEAWEDCLVKDGLLIKFFLPYAIVVSAKRWMIAIGMLDSDSIVLDKGHGRYCPRADKWILALLSKEVGS